MLGTNLTPMYLFITISSLLLFAQESRAQDNAEMVGEIIASTKSLRKRYEAGGEWSMSFEWNGIDDFVRNIRLYRDGRKKCMQIDFKRSNEISCITEKASFRLKKQNGKWVTVNSKSGVTLPLVESHWLLTSEFALAPVSLFGLNPIDELMSSPKFEVTKSKVGTEETKISFKLNKGHKLGYLLKNKEASGSLSFMKKGENYYLSASDITLLDGVEVKNYFVKLNYDKNVGLSSVEARINQVNKSYSYKVNFDSASFAKPPNDVFKPGSYGVVLK